MKRHAFLIGYTGEDSNEETIEGVLCDLERYQDYLRTLKGGAWNDNEITVLNNTTKTILKTNILCKQAEGLDFAFVVFSGHGDFDDIENGCRRFLLNKKEILLEKDLWNVAKKQILICDSCAGRRSKSSCALESIEKKSQILIETASGQRELARSKYEEWCKSCDEQLIRLYAAKVGTFAEDKDGGIYTTELINELRNAQTSMSIVGAHDIAKINVIKKTNGQIPERQVRKGVNKFLPGAITIQGDKLWE